MKRILIIHPEGNSYNNPTMKAIIDMFVSRGMLVTIFHQQTIAPMPKNTSVEYVKWSKAWGWVRSQLLRKGTITIINALFYFEKFRFSDPFDLIVGVDREGLMQASYLANTWKSPYIFISFEIMVEQETSTRFKNLERKASKKVAHWVVQDAERANILAHENGLSMSNCIFVPLGSKGKGVLSKRRLRDYLEIDTCKNVAILMGSMSSWSMTPEIIESLRNWPDSWCLILNERYGNKDDFLKKQLSTVSDLIGKKLFIATGSAEKVDEMAYTLSGVDLGLAFYKPIYSSPFTGENLQSLGLASGKISTYLRYGIPVIMNEIGLYSSLARRHKFGLVIDDPRDLPTKLIGFNSTTYSQEARHFFAEHLDFALYEEQLWSAFKTTVDRPSVGWV